MRRAKTGLRPGELRHLLIEEVDFESGWLQIRNKPELDWRTKTGRERPVPLIDELVLVLRRVIDGRTNGDPLFLDDESKDLSLSDDRNSPDFWKYPTLPAEAKAWHVPLNRPSTINSKREYPPEQLEWYLDRSHLDFGILTNGGLWKLVPRDYAPQQRRFQTYLECDLAGLLECWSTSKSIAEKSSLTDEFLQFFLFFGPAGYRKVGTLLPLIERSLRGSSEYRVGVGEGLRERAFEALRLCIQGFLLNEPNELYPKLHLELCREQSFILLYRLLFIMFAEDRRLLPYRVHSAYTNNRSLGRHRDEIGGRLDRIREGEDEDFSRDSTAIWDDLQVLFDLVDRGHRRYGVPEYNGGLFDADAQPFLDDMQISDYYMARIIDQLGRAVDPVNPGAGLFAVDYRDLAIQHLGGIYEGLLELHPTYALKNMVVISRRVKGRVEEKYLSETDPMPRGWQSTDERCREGSIYLETKKGERRASGSYYTPDHIVNHIVENTLGPVCNAVSDELDRDIAAEEELLRQATGDERTRCEARLEKLRCDFDDRILKLKVLDPAMGSGHFLIRACQRLAEEIATHQYTGDESLASIPEDESAVSFWKRRAVENCIFGVDINGLAVELAKLVLWLETVSPTEPLSFLNHHLRHGNSLVGGRVAEMGALPGEGALGRSLCGERVEKEVPTLLEPLNEISEISSDTADHVKEKARLYRRFEKSRNSLMPLADQRCIVGPPVAATRFVLPQQDPLVDRLFLGAALRGR